MVKISIFKIFQKNLKCFLLIFSILVLFIFYVSAEVNSNGGTSLKSSFQSSFDNEDLFEENVDRLSSPEPSTVYLMFPRNNQPLGGTNNTIPFIFNHTGFLIGNVNCTLHINSTPVAYVELVPPNQPIKVFSNISLTPGIYFWNVSCFNGTQWDNSTTFRFDIASCEFGSWGDVCQINATKNFTSGFINASDIEILDSGKLTTSARPGTTLEIYARNVVIRSSGSILGNVNITASNLTIYPGGKIDASAKGYPGGGAASDGQGPGAGKYGACCAGSGAGYGGYGGADENGDLGGSPYGNATHPTDLGSGGGGSAYNRGGYGGGAIFLNVSDVLVVNGSILANGENGIPNSGGAFLILMEAVAQEVAFG